MNLITPDLGLFFWQTVIFLILLLVLTRFAWKPILSALKSRQESIELSLKEAAKARRELEKLRQDNEKLLIKAKAERDQLIKDALNTASEIKEKARFDAIKDANKILSDAQQSIEKQKEAALLEIKSMVGDLSLSIAEKLIRTKMTDDIAQRQLMESYLKEIKLN
ncbi:MAG: F0F1 ATP synthase subunit B [Cyclobacteriaceae bacterium]|nr:F0F1 ATP synthase subunit B [Cyclobacteriaceae bacterium]